MSIPLVEHDARYTYDEVVPWIVDSVAGLGEEYQQHVRDAFSGRWIDVFENTGKRSGAYSAPVYGTHPYMLLNFNETLDAVFTLAHEMGHSMHTLLAHRAQPFVYAGYTIFVAEVPSTLNEALFLDFMLERADTANQQAVLLQHAIDSIASTFYTQVMFADFELQAHRLVEQDQPITAEVLSGIYSGLLREYYGDVLDEEPLSSMTWARIPHFFSTPYYVYQYATCFASTARLMQDLRSSDRADEVGRSGSLSDAAARRWQRLSDGSAQDGGGGPQPARHGSGRGERARHARLAARGACAEIGQKIRRFDAEPAPRCIITSG